MGYFADATEVDGLGAPGRILSGSRQVPALMRLGRSPATPFRSYGLDKTIAAHILRREQHDE